MKQLNLVQGTPEWKEHRAKSRNASDASAMMGENPNETRDELVRRLATGEQKERSSYTEEVIFAKGNEVEPRLRAWADRTFDLDFYPMVGVSEDGYLSASFDGVTLAETDLLETKQSNKSKMETVRGGSVPSCDYWQCVHQLAVCDTARRLLYAVGDGTEAGTVSTWLLRVDVLDDIATLRAAWAQLDADVAAYVYEPAPLEVVARAQESLPALKVQLDGVVEVSSNLPLFEQLLVEQIARIPANPDNDQDFADCKSAVAELKKAEESLQQAERNALAQIEPVEIMRRKVADLSNLARTHRLATEKLVKTRDEAVKAEMLSKAQSAITEHLAAINDGLAVKVGYPVGLALDVAEARKNKKSLASMRSAISQVIADTKIKLTETAKMYRANLAVLEACGRSELFGDRDALVASKQPDDLQNLAKARIAEADAREQARIAADRERIRIEEEARAKREAERLAEKERERIRREEREAAQKEQQAVATPSPAPAPAELAPTLSVSDAATTVAPAAAAQVFAPAANAAEEHYGTLNVGEINARIAPLSITGEGLAKLGLQPLSTVKSMKLYSEAQFITACNAAIAQLIAARGKTYPKKEAA